MKKFIKKALTAIAIVPAIVLSLGVAAIPAVSTYAACGDVSTGIKGGIDCGNTGGGQATSLFGSGGIFTTVINVLLFIIGAISVIMLIVGGIRYTTSAGNSTAVTGAKNTIMYAIIGLIIAFLAYAIVNWVLSALGGNTNA